MTTARRIHQVGAISCLLLALVPGYYAVTLRWAPRIDFDVIGILFLLENIPRLAAWMFTFGFLFAAGWFWVRSLRT